MTRPYSHTAYSYGKAGSGRSVMRSFASNTSRRLPSRFWKGLLLKSPSAAATSVFRSWISVCPHTMKILTAYSSFSICSAPKQCKDSILGYILRQLDLDAVPVHYYLILKTAFLHVIRDYRIARIRNSR